MPTPTRQKPSPNDKSEKEPISLKTRLENHLGILLTSFSLAAFCSGIGVYETAMRFFNYEKIDRFELERLRKGASEPVNPSIVERSAVSSIDLQKMANPPRWAHNLVHWLDTEGEIKKRDYAAEKMTYYFGSEILYYQFDRPTKNFTVNLKGNDGKSTVGEIFILNREDLVNPLVYETAEASGGLIFRVPEAETGDKLIVIVRTESSKSFSGEDLKTTFQLRIL